MDTIGTSEIVLYMEVSLLQRLSNTVIHYCGTRASAINREVLFIQRVLNKEVPLYKEGGRGGEGYVKVQRGK